MVERKCGNVKKSAFQFYNDVKDKLLPKNNILLYFMWSDSILVKDHLHV